MRVPSSLWRRGLVSRRPSAGRPRGALLTALVCALLVFETPSNAKAQTAPEAARLPASPQGSPPPSGEADIVVTAPRDQCLAEARDLSARLACTNSAMLRAANGSGFEARTLAPDASSPDLQVGLVNLGATRQRMGSNYGVSAFPARPPRPHYSSPRSR